MRSTTMLAILVLACAVLASGAKAATKRIENRQYVGFLQYANPFFIQGYAALAPTANQPLNRETVVTLYVQRIRGGTVTELGTQRPVLCNQTNPEGEAAMGLRCGFSIPLGSSSNATSGSNAALRAGDRLRIKIAGATGGGVSVRLQPTRMDTVLFDFPIGQAEKFLKPGQGNGQGEAPGNFYFQGRIQQIRADSIRGYAVDDLFLAGRPANNVNIFNPTTVRVKIWQQVNGGRWSVWTEINNLNADRTTETPLVQTSPGAMSNQGTGGTWPFGWVANLPPEKRLDNVSTRTKYFVRLEEARWRGGGTPIDARVVEFAGKDAVAVIRSYDFKRDGATPAEVTLQGSISAAQARKMTETLETRALLEREEFLRRTPPAKEGETSQLKPAPERLYGFTGETDHGERGTLPPPPVIPGGSVGATDTGRTPVAGLDPQGRAAQPEINLRPGELANAGGFSRRRTNAVWVESAGDNQNKRYVYEWSYNDPAFEKFVTVAFDARGTGGAKSRRERINEVITGMTLPAASAAGTAGTTTPAAPPLAGGTRQPATTTPTTSATSKIEDKGGFILVYTKAGEPQSWTAVTTNSELNSKRDTDMPKCQEKLDTAFNNYDLEFEVAALSPDQRRGLVDRVNAASADSTAPRVTNPFSREARSKTVKVKLLGEWKDATWDTSEEVKARLHPLKVTARYMYERAFQKLQKDFDAQRAAGATGVSTATAGPTTVTSSTAGTTGTTGTTGAAATAQQRTEILAQIEQKRQRMVFLRSEIPRLVEHLRNSRANPGAASSGNPTVIESELTARRGQLEALESDTRVLRQRLDALPR